MKNMLSKALITLTTVTLSACSLWNTNEPAGTQRAVSPSNRTLNTAATAETTTPMSNASVSQDPVGGDIAHAMDSIDKSKMSHALDNPLGKSSHWVNANTGISYTVVPVQKVEVNGNPFCRKYITTAVKNNRSQELTGTACVGSDGTWQAMS